MWRSCLWGSQLGSSSAVLSQLTGSWRGRGEVLEGPGRLPSLREPNWNSVYLTADTPLCLFLSVSLNPFLYFWLSRFFENKNTRALLPVSFFLLFLIYMHTPYLKHTVTYRRCLSNIFFPLSLSFFAVQNLLSYFVAHVPSSAAPLRPPSPIFHLTCHFLLLILLSFLLSGRRRRNYFQWGVYGNSGVQNRLTHGGFKLDEGETPSPPLEHLLSGVSCR